MKKNNSLIIQEWLSKDCAVVWLNRPEARNSYNKELVQQLIDTLLKLQKNPHIKLCLIRAKGKDFCSGGDIKSMLTKTDLFQGPSQKLKANYKKYIQKLSLVLDELNYLTISIVQGGAIGAGVGLALGCDLVWAQNDAYLCLPFNSLALVPADGSFLRVQRRASYAVALELLLTSKKVFATDAFDLGLIDFIGEENDFKKKLSEYKTQLFSREDWGQIILSLRQTKLNNLSLHLEKMRNIQSILQLKENHNRAIKAILK